MLNYQIVPSVQSDKSTEAHLAQWSKVQHTKSSHNVYSHTEERNDRPISLAVQKKRSIVKFGVLTF